MYEHISLACHETGILLNKYIINYYNCTHAVTCMSHVAYNTTLETNVPTIDHWKIKFQNICLDHAKSYPNESIVTFSIEKTSQLKVSTYLY